ncbi:MAG: tetratricopeptide repeat protein [Bacteroidales bacterium]|nr:tetratricopeptide repeat protein [Bacteroidales bacterium]
MRKLLILTILALSLPVSVLAQVDRKEIRSGNRKFDKNDYRGSAVEYMRALDADSLSVAGNYNLASAHYRLGEYNSAAERLGKLKDVIAGNEYEADYYFNLGDAAVAKKDWQGAVDAFKKCLLVEPGNLEAKENYIYAKKHLDNQQNGGQGQNQNQDQNQDQQQNQDDKQDQNQENQDKQQNKPDQQNQNQQQQPQQAEVKVSPQQAQQMLQAIQAKEKKTQEKVEKEKAAAAGRDREKNW